MGRRRAGTLPGLSRAIRAGKRAAGRLARCAARTDVPCRSFRGSRYRYAAANADWAEALKPSKFFADRATPTVASSSNSCGAGEDGTTAFNGPLSR
jgi:hypothetical protein